VSSEPSIARKPFVVVAVIDQEDRLDAVLKALARRGHGATVFHSLGMGRLRAQQRQDVPLIASLAKFFESRTDLNVTLISVVEGENAVWDVISAIEGEIGDLSEPHTGIAFAMPITHLTGYLRYQTGQMAVGPSPE